MRKFDSGFTLVETVLAGFIVTVVMVVGYLFWERVMSSYFSSTSSTQNIFDVNAGLRQITREMREARDGEDGAYLLSLVNDTEIAFYSDIDEDSQTERVRYFLQGDELKRGVVEPEGLPPSYTLGNEVVKTVLENVDVGGVTFSYYNENWPGDVVNNPLSQEKRFVDTKLVKVFLRLRRTDDVSSETFELSGDVQLRNAKSN